MKAKKADTLWYNSRDKEIGCIILKAHEDMVRRTSPYPDPRTGMRMMAVSYDCFQSIIP